MAKINALYLKQIMSWLIPDPHNKASTFASLLHDCIMHHLNSSEGCACFITWKGSQPSGSSRYHWSTSDWAELHRWACQRRGQTGATQRSPCKKDKLVSVTDDWVEQVTHVTLSALLTWSFCTQTWCRALCQAATPHWAASAQTGVHPQSSALCRASLWSKSAGGHVWAAHPLRWSGNNPTSRSGRLYPWAGLPDLPLLSVLVHHSSWASEWA